MAQPAIQAAVRLALLSSPRSGNTWLREVLALAYGLEQIALHDQAQLPSELPERVIVQMHCDRTEGLIHRWNEERVRVVSVARHPFDALISMLHFARHERDVSRWPGGEHLGPVVGANPASDEFARFAVGPGAGRLLAVTPQWWCAPGTVRLRYEQMCQDPVSTLEAVRKDLGDEPLWPFASALSSRPLGYFQAMPNHHGWRGEPGLWRSLLIPDLAYRIRTAHPEPFEALGYACDPDVDLTSSRAESNWNALAVRVAD